MMFLQFIRYSLTLKKGHCYRDEAAGAVIRLPLARGDLTP